MSFDPPAEDDVRLFPPLQIGGHEVALEVEIHGAWQDGTYVSRTDRTPAVLLAMKLMWELVMERSRKQQEGTA